MPHDAEVIQHLSKEIETHTVGMTTFRTRIAFVLFVGPYFLLGSYLVVTKTTPRLPSVDVYEMLLTWRFLLPSAFCLLGFVSLGYVAAKIEQDAWYQCNIWRREIERIYNGTGRQVDVSQGKGNTLGTRGPYHMPEKLMVGYLVMFAVMSVLFSAVAFLSRGL